MQLAVGALPARQHSGGGIVERVEIDRAELLGACGIKLCVFRLVRPPGHFRHAQQGVVGEGIRVGVLVAEADGVPPIGGAQSDRFRPGAGVAAGGVFEKPVAILIHGQHFGGPVFQPRVVLLQPRLILAAADVIPGGNQQRGIGIQEVVAGGWVIGGITRHAVGFHAAEVAVQRGADQVERRQARRQGRRARRHRRSIQRP